MNQEITVSAGEDGELVVRTVFPECDCEAYVTYRSGDEVGEYRCSCKNELIVGPGAATKLTPEATGTTGTLTTNATWGEEVEVAWHLRKLKPEPKKTEAAVG